MRVRDPRDSDAWSHFVDLYRPLILRYARQRGLQEADAADVAQDVLVAVASAIRSFDYQPERGRFRDWLGTVARHRIHRFLRSESRKAHGIASDWLDGLPATEPDSQWSEAFDAHVLNAALDRARPYFEDATWEAFRLTWLKRCPATDAATELNMPVANVYVSKSRVLKRLREEVLAIADDWPLDPNSPHPPTTHA
ncbi:MAG: sigma-70 family RNA polymerase sigma factor [Gemmataceae bacterium]|nr:sigma-70 family RNA polymerase sigma factor [Gemmataceae bacterium]